jgi:translation initiation factor IF-1
VAGSAETVCVARAYKVELVVDVMSHVSGEMREVAVWLLRMVAAVDSSRRKAQCAGRFKRSYRGSRRRHAVWCEKIGVRVRVHTSG